MNFEKAEKEFILLKTAYQNGIIDKEEYLNNIRNELIVNDEKSGRWMLDEGKGNWLWFDDLNNEWIRRNRPGYKVKEEEYIIEIKVPEPPKIDEETKKQIEEYKKSNGNQDAEEKVKVESEKKCPKCGQPVESNYIFCANCGEKII